MSPHLPMTAAERASPAGYLHRLRHGRLPLARLFFVDMLVWGTLLNLTTTGVSLALFAGGAPAFLAVLVWVLPWPVNALFALGVWRAADGHPSRFAAAAGPLATLWAIAASLV